ncbi:hypothetical protein WAF17_02600 [Bernardetia sp. ABR2-2B]|uniref:hypothetical protein n=1 Tax=Bernardetia sp. ABR2-2B TaxID=3127472 RepID=UPI0030CE5B93
MRIECPECYEFTDIDEENDSHICNQCDAIFHYDKEELTVRANTTFEINATCPHCETFQDLNERYSAELGELGLNNEDLDFEVECKKCKKPFFIEAIDH